MINNLMFQVELLGTVFYGVRERVSGKERIVELGVHVWESEPGLLQDLGALARCTGQSGRALMFVSWESQGLMALSEL